MEVWEVTRNVTVIIILLGILLPGCNNDPVSVESRSAGLYVTVVTEDGSPIVGASVHYIFYSTGNTNQLNAHIGYPLSTPQVVTLKVFDPFDREVGTPVDSVLQPAGFHAVLVSDSSYTNGVYSYTLQTADSLQKGSFYLRDDDIARLEQKSPLTVSDDAGELFLSPDVLGIGRMFHNPAYTDIISDSISIVLVKENYLTLVESFRLDTTIVTGKRFVLEPN